MTIKYIELKDLAIARENTRKSRALDEIKTLAASIEAIGLLHTLVGYEEKGKTFITDGGTRLKAIRRLVKGDKSQAKRFETLPVLICDKAQALDVSLSANLVRSVMTVTDQFTAFQKLHYTDGVQIENIAKRYFVDSATVRRILKLASLAKPIFAALKGGEISLDVAKAYAGCDDQERQSRIFERLGTDAGSYAVRNALRQNTYLADSAKVAFIGLEAYREQGGVIEDDLFEERTVLVNGETVDQLFETAIEEQLDALRDDGWAEVKFFDNSCDFYDAQRQCGERICPILSPTKAQSKTLKQLDKKIEKMGEYWSLDFDERKVCDALQEDYDALQQEASSYNPQDVETGTVLCYFGSNGFQSAAFASKANAQSKTEKVERAFSKSFERNVMATAGDALMEHMTQIPSNMSTVLVIAALEFAYFPMINLSLSHRSKLKFDRGLNSENEEGDDDFSRWTASFDDKMARIKELASMSEVERQIVLAGLLRDGFAMGGKGSDHNDQMKLYHYLSEETGLELSEVWTFSEAELKCLTKAQLLRVLKTMGLNPMSFSKAKKSELVTLAARYAAEQKWVPEFMRVSDKGEVIPDKMQKKAA